MTLADILQHREFAQCLFFCRLASLVCTFARVACHAATTNLVCTSAYGFARFANSWFAYIGFASHTCAFSLRMCMLGPENTSRLILQVCKTCCCKCATHGFAHMETFSSIFANKILFFVAIFQSLCAQIWHMYMHVLRYATTWFAKLATLMCMLIVFKTCVFTNMCICLPYCSCCKFASLGGKLADLVCKRLDLCAHLQALFSDLQTWFAILQNQRKSSS